MIVMIAGVYGVGKSTICNKLSNDLKIKFFSASELIKSEKGFITWDKYKKTDQISSNQDFLVNAINRMSGIDFLLDGHFCLLDKEGNIKKIEFDVIDKLNIGAVLLLKESTDVICNRLMDRDKISWDESLIIQMQEIEEKQAFKFTTEYNLPFKSFYVSDYEVIKKIHTKLIQSGNHK
ncbi:ATP-binding protein [Morganella psychrotolerans]|uniref:AAA family ATPase n=1 Tax=Morganella psychrotolerans TaxID=368603 RepID=A0A1B8HMT9_9GAMM|nr:ATP-binding protein [Morganella psychrotolerans]OBU10765.1 hypothetical protein AYY17_14695 [Morganella psychrotolerans]